MIKAMQLPPASGDAFLFLAFDVRGAAIPLTSPNKFKQRVEAVAKENEPGWCEQGNR